MKAMVLKSHGRRRKPLEYMDVSTPEPGPREILVRVVPAAICRTDLIRRGRDPAAQEKIQSSPAPDHRGGGNAVPGRIVSKRENA